MGHTQPATPLKTDNATALSFIQNNITQKRSKSWDMRYYWLRDKQLQKSFDFYWNESKKNIADYHTKHHAINHHQEVRHQYVRDKTSDTQSDLQGCAGVGTRARDRQTRMTSPDVIGVGIRGQPQITDEESGSHLM